MIGFSLGPCHSLLWLLSEVLLNFYPMSFSHLYPCCNCTLPLSLIRNCDLEEHLIEPWWWRWSWPLTCWLVWIPWQYFIEFCHHESFKAYSILPLSLIPNCALTAHSFQHFTGAFIASVVLIPPFIVNIGLLYSCVLCLKTCTCLSWFVVVYHQFSFLLTLFVPACQFCIMSLVILYPIKKFIFFICFWTMLHHLFFVTAIHRVMSLLWSVPCFITVLHHVSLCSLSFIRHNCSACRPVPS